MNEKEDKEIKDEKETNKSSSNDKVIPYFQLYRFATKKDKLLMAIGSLFAIIMGVALPLFTVVFGQVLNKFISLTPYMPEDQQQDIINDINLNIIYMVFIGIGAFICSYILMSFWIIASENQAKKIREMYLKAILNQEIAWFDTHPSGELVSRLTSDINMIQEGISEKFAFVLQYVVTFIAGFVVAYTKGAKLAGVLTAVIPLLIAAAAVMGKVIVKDSKKEQDAYADASTVAEESISGIRTVTSFSAQEYACQRFQSKLGAAFSVGVRSSITRGLGLGTVFFFLFSTYSLAFYYGSILIQYDGYGGGDVVNVLFAIIMGAFSLGNSAPHLASFGKAQGAATTIYATIERESLIPSNSKEGKTMESINGTIEFKNVDFCYPSRPDITVLKNFNLTVPAGKTVALVGESGSGKSTAVHLIERFYDCSGGSVTIDGNDIKEFNVKWLRQQIGVVSQEPVLFNKSIQHNVLYGIAGTPKGEQVKDFDNPPESIKQELLEACKKANANEFISRLPQGYNTIVGHKGGQISGGQKQRIAIARAILKNPAILLLDEATSALDTESERLVQAALENASKNRTTLVIAHRLSTIRNADLIVVMEKGLIVEQGSHQELFDKKGLYYRLVQAQEVRKLKTDSLVTEEIKAAEVAITEEKAVTKDIVSKDIKIKSTEDKKKEEEAKLQEEIREKNLKAFSWGRVAEHLGPKEYTLMIIGGLASAINGAVMPLYAILFSSILETFSKISYDVEGFRSGSNFWAGLFLALAVASFFAILVENAITGIGSERLCRRLRIAAFSSIMKQNIGFFDHPHNAAGILTAKLSTDASQVHSLTTPIVTTMCKTLSNLTVGFAIAFSYGWQLTLVILSILPVIVFSSFIQMKTIKGSSQRIKQQYEKTAADVTEAIDNIRTVAMLTIEDFISSNYNEEVGKPHKKAVQNALVSSIGFGFSQGILYWVYVITFAYGSHLILTGVMTAGDMFHVMFSVVFVAVNLGQTASLAPDFAKAKVAAGGVFELIDAKSEIDYTNPDGKRPENPKGDVVISKASFSYPARPENKILDELDLKADSGMTVALVGASGSGKSTVISLMERFYDVTSGQVKFDNTPVPEWNILYYRQQLALVGQEPILFSGTIKENISYGCLHGEVKDDDIERVAKMANISEFVSRLPDGFNTNLGNKGTQLSGGQKQRIAIARALIRNPKVLLLDEATSALDSESEKVVQDALDVASKGRTTLVIAHRLSTIQNADEILFVEKGKVLEKGTHDELLKLDGCYAKLVQKQVLGK